MNTKTDTRPVDCRFFDRNNQLVGTVKLAPRGEAQPPRKIVFDCRTFIEGDGTGFYAENEFAEVEELAPIKLREVFVEGNS